MRLPRGRLVRSRVVEDLAVPLAAALDRELTGYVRLEPQEAVLLDDTSAGPGVITVEAGVPVLAYSAGADRGGAEALADLAMPGPCAAELFELPAERLEPAHERSEFRVPPGMPAERLAGDPALADRTRSAAPEALATASGERGDDAADPGAVEAFLADEEKIAAIRERAREEARARAAEWGLADQLAEDSAGSDGAGRPADDRRRPR